MPDSIERGSLKSKDTLKSFFENGDIPTEDHFADLIESFSHLSDPENIKSIVKAPGGNVIITLGDDTIIEIKAKPDAAVDSDKLGGINASGYVRKGKKEPQAWYGNHLMFNCYEDGNNIAAISLNDQGNAFHFNTDGPLTNKSSNANLHAKQFFSSLGFFEDGKKLATQDYVNGRGFINSVNWADVEAKPNLVRSNQISSRWGFVLPDGTDQGWLRTTRNGIIPFQEDTTNGFSQIGTSSWPFQKIYAKEFYESNQKLSDKYLGKSAKATSATNADKLGGVAASGYSRTNHSHTPQSIGALPTGGTAVNADKLGGVAANSYARTNHTHTPADIGALPVGGTAANALKFDDKHSSEFLLKSGGTMTGNLVMTNRVILWSENTDAASIGFYNEAGVDESYMYFKTSDNSNEYFKWVHKDYRESSNQEWMSLKKNGLTVNGKVASQSVQSSGSIKSNSNFELEPGSGKGIRFWSSDNYKIYMSHAPDATWGGRLPGDTTSDHNMYFRMTGGYNRGFVFQNEKNSVAGIDGNGNGRFAGSITAAGDITAFSDKSLKSNIQSISDNFLTRISKLKPSYYNWKDESKSQRTQMGFIAQEVKELFPEWVHENGEYLSLSYDKMGAVLAVKGIQELHSEIEVLKAELKLMKDGIVG